MARFNLHPFSRPLPLGHGPTALLHQPLNPSGGYIGERFLDGVVREGFEFAIRGGDGNCDDRRRIVRLLIEVAEIAMELYADDAEIEMVVESLCKFVRQEIVPIEERFRSVLDDQRGMYDSAGRPVPAYKEARRAARVASAAAGYYALCAPSELGGGGQAPM